MTGRVLECAGAPRDLGLDQGTAARDAIRREVGRSRRCARAADPTLDLDRYFPHLGERLAGIARGARVARTELVARLVRDELGGISIGVGPHRSGAGAPLLARAIDLPRDRAMPLVARRLRPDHGCASLSVTLPWLPAGLVGVNEAGLAASCTPIPAAGAPGAPPLLLLEDCLLRFETAEAAVDWCLRRPAGGTAALVFADARGGLAGALVDGARRRPLQPVEGVLVAASGALRHEGVEKACAGAARLDAADLHAILASHEGAAQAGDETPCRHGEREGTAAIVLLDPAARTLACLRGQPCLSAPSGAERVGFGAS